MAEPQDLDKSIYDFMPTPEAPDEEVVAHAVSCNVKDGYNLGQVAEAVAKLDNTGKVDVTLVWDPAWTPERMSEDARLALGMM